MRSRSLISAQYKWVSHVRNMHSEVCANGLVRTLVCVLGQCLELAAYGHTQDFKCGQEVEAQANHAATPVS